MTAMRSALDRGRALLSAYLDRGRLSPGERAEVATLLEERKGLPSQAGSPLQTALYLVGVAFVVLQLVGAGEARAAEDRLVQALLSGRPEVTAAAEPFDGLLFDVGERLARELGDAETARRMADGARRAAAGRARRAQALGSLLGMPVADDDPPDC